MADQDQPDVPVSDDAKTSRRGLLKAGLIAGAAVGVGGWRGEHGHRTAAGAVEAENLRKPGSLPYPNLQGRHRHDPEDRAHRRADDGEPFLRQQARPAEPAAVPMASASARTASPTRPTRTPTVTSSTRSGCRPRARTTRPPRTGRTATSSSRPARLDGFVKSGSGATAMGYWQWADQPFYYSLARQFPIADRYFCSLLGQTDPNRRFLMSATSMGMVNDDIEMVNEYPKNGTIFDRLRRSTERTWKNYYTTCRALSCTSRSSRRTPASRSSTSSTSSPTARRASCRTSAWSSRTTTTSRRRIRRTSRVGEQFAA